MKQINHSSKLKILFLPAWYPSEENPVLGIFIKEQAKAVSLYNEVVILYSQANGRNLKKCWQIFSDKEEEGIRTIRIKHKKFFISKINYIFYLWSIWQAFPYLLKEGWKPDIIHAHIYLAGVPAIILGKRYKLPVVISEHFSALAKHNLNKLEILKAKFALNKAEMVLPVSKNLENHIKSYGVNNRFRIIPNVVNFEVFYPVERKPLSPPKILLVSLLNPKKGIPYLFQALAQLKEKRQDFILDIVGDGPTRQEYEDLAKRLNILDLVKFHGLKTNREVAAYMRNCDFFVLPSLGETFGVVYLEAMACGKPIVATGIPFLPKEREKEFGVMVKPEDINGLKEALDYLLEHYQNYSPEKICQYAKEKFSYEKIGKELENIYQTCLK